MHVLPFLVIALSISTIFATHPLQDLPGIISNEVDFVRLGKSPHKLASLVKQVLKIGDKKLADDVLCQTCDLVFSQILAYRRVGASKDSMVDFFNKLCRVFTDWGPVACAGYINIEIDTALYIMDNRKELAASRICGIYFQSKGCVDPNANPWTVPIPAKLRHTHRHEHRHHASAAPLKILHLTDFHYDPLYEPGSNAACDLPLCCQKGNGPAPTPASEAGFWGDYHVCDIPWHSVTNFTAYLTNLNETYDLVYYTGDIISHRSWATNKDDNTKALKKLFQHFKDTFDNTTVFAILGNHEPHPTDFWSERNVTAAISTQWMFDLVASEWARWLPNSTVSDIKTGGYYTVLVRPKFRIIALNSNVCFVSNLWLIYDDHDPYGQLNWLTATLTKAEKNGEIVHILSHIPPGELLCNQRWSNQFRQIVQRFAPIIAAQFNGHTHLDELRLFRDVNTTKVINVAFNAGSFTTFVGFNPNYRTYDVDPATYRVLDYDHYTYNLTKANLDRKNPPQWFKLYSFKSDYGLKNTSNEALGDLVARMGKNKTLAQQYFRFQGRDSAPHVKPGCDDLCMKKLVCGITAVETLEMLRCQQMTKTHHKQ